MCVLQTWYLSADMQLYLLSPLLLLPLSRSASRGCLLLGGCYLATTVAAFANAYWQGLPAGATVTMEKKTEQNHGSEYVQTHVRAASWLTGMAMGYILHQIRQGKLKWKISKNISAVLWVAAVAMCVTAVYSIAPFQSLQYSYSPVVDSLHIAVHRNIFSLGASGIILLCVCGRGGIVRDFLSWKGFQPLGTLSYGVYLSHMGLQAMGLARLRQPLPFDMYNLFSGVLSDLLLANLAAVVIFLSVEAPFWQIGTWLYNPNTGSRTTAVVAVEKHPETINMEEEKSSL
uniref:Acyltransferase 3 domain-containing protein n=2 Tax=Graphocephala atropunctata TaxID=36148 RepID=A0A1B6MIC6_9HEMI